MKKLVSFFLAMCLLITVSACSKSGQSSSEQTNSGNTLGNNSTNAEQTNVEKTGANTAEEKKTDIVQFPLKEKISLKIMAPLQHQSNPPNKDMPVFKKLFEETNIEIEWETVAPEGYNEAVNTRMAAGVDLPDMVQILQMDKIYNLGKDGIIVPLNDLLDKNAPEMIKYFESHPSVKAAHVFPDGNIYVLGQIIYDDFFTRGYIINRNMLAQSGAKMPGTVDEYYDMLSKMKQSGVKIPLSTIWDMEMLFAQGFGIYAGTSIDDGYYADDSGIVKNAYAEPGMKDVLMWLNKLYKENLLDKEFDTQTWDAFTAKVANKQIGAVNAFQGAAWTLLSLTNEKDVIWEYLPPLKASNGKQVALKENGTSAPGSGFAITSKCKYPNEAMRLLSWSALDEKAYVLNQFGIEGTSYELMEGKCKRIGGIEDAIKIGALWPFPTAQSIDLYMKTAYADPADMINRLFENSLKLRSYLVDRFPNNPLSDEEMQTFQKYSADITTYGKEMKIKFIKGQESLDKFDDYLKKLKELGIDELIKVNQGRYDRFKKSVK